VIFDNKYTLIDRKLYSKDTLTVAKKLLGCYITKEMQKYTLVAKIVETEAYLGNNDPACHAFQKLTNRNRPMFEEGGISYVYFIYGNYYCFNVVTEQKGIGAAVLIRAVEPIDGIDQMRKNRKYQVKDINLTNGPAKFCMAFDIGRQDNSLNLTEDRIRIYRSKRKEDFTIAITPRIGIKDGAEFPYRFFIKDNPYVTKHKLNKEIITEIKS
jgi:DNA-3-methyladenine glycosylase